MAYTPTYLEAPEDVQDAVELLRQKKLKPAAPAGDPVVVPAVEEAQLFAPTRRPPLTLLCILDDGKKDEGHWLRLHNHKLTIGRSEGDVRIGIDDQMSGRHAELVRTEEDGWRWTLIDLGSTNGTFVRIAKTGLQHSNEFLVGSGRYRFENSANGVVTEPFVSARQSGTVNWEGDANASARPTLVEVIHKEKTSQRYPLTQGEYWIGRDGRQCAIARPGDPFASPRHARLFRDAKHASHWVIENNKSLNGLWLRVERIQLGRTCQFQLGEQRFLLKVV